jgi:ABC-type branched-subunit amino acid transport system permease subunit
MALTVVLAWIFGLGAQPVVAPNRSLSDLVTLSELMFIFGLPFVWLAGNVFGPLHGYLTTRLARQDANAPIVT